jgi:hypothetical protein
MDALNLAAHRFGGHSTHDVDALQSRFSCGETPISRLEEPYAREASPMVQGSS